MSADRAYAWYGSRGRVRSVPDGPPDASAVLGAVREDIRQTLRTGWIDPALDAAATSPAFFTAAWSAIRPNVGRSFLLLARALRIEAVDAVRATMTVHDLRRTLALSLSEEEQKRAEESARAAQLATAKVQIVVHAMLRALRRERARGTGHEESPVRRGVPDWQRWMAFHPAHEAARPTLDEAEALLGVPGAPAPLRLLARWPVALTAVWEEAKPALESEEWGTAVGRLRRILLAGISTLPHPIELQWAALRERGFLQEDRARLADQLAAYESSMASQTLLAAFTWAALGAPEIGVEA